MNPLPQTLSDALRPVTLVIGHYGTGKTNFAVNLAIDNAALGKRVVLVDLDIVNPYFRASEQRRVLEEHGVELVAPVFAEVGSSLDVPSLTGKIAPSIESAGTSQLVIIDAGGDDVGATALGRFSRAIAHRNHAMLAVVNRYRNMVQDPFDAARNLSEIEQACRLEITGLVSNAHLLDETTQEIVEVGQAYALEVSKLVNVPLVATTVPRGVSVEGAYRVERYVKPPWDVV